MPGEKSDAEIKRYLVRIAEGDRAAMGDLVLGLKPPAERGIRAGFVICRCVDHGRCPIDPGGIGDKVFFDFLGKLQTSTYLSALQRADSPSGHANATTRNMTIDELKKELGQGMVSSLSEETVAARAAEVAAADDAGPADEHRDAVREFFDNLPIDSAILLEVLLVEFREPPPSHIEKIAADRGVTIAQVQADLDERARVQDTQRHQDEEDIVERQARIARLNREIAAIELTVAEVDRAPGEAKGRPVEADLVLTAERAKELSRSAAAVRKASPEERSAYLRSRYELQETYARTLQAARKKVAREYAAGPRYEEVVRILGLADPNDPKAMKRARDTVTTRANRLLKRLRGIHGGRRG